jgi:transcriptional regulator with XRE-family HTH domain
MDNKTIGKRLKILRLKHDLKQHHLAREFHVSRSTISSWENGTRQIPSIDLSRMAEKFGVAIDYFFGKEGNGIQVQQNNEQTTITYFYFKEVFDWLSIILNVGFAFSAFLLVFIRISDRVLATGLYWLATLILSIFFIFRSVYILMKNSKQLSFPVQKTAYFHHDGLVRKQNLLDVISKIIIPIFFCLTYGLLIFISDQYMDNFGLIFAIIMIGFPCLFLLLITTMKSIFSTLIPKKIEYNPTNKYFGLRIYDILLLVNFVLSNISIGWLIAYGPDTIPAILLWISMSLLMVISFFMYLLKVDRLVFFKRYRIMID